MTSAPAIQSDLLRWFDVARRDLPWRRTRDPYAILVSEVMLQQTRVETVIPYFCRFLERFPDAAALAAAPESEVLAHWAGLGYYRRARFLRSAAAAIVNEHGGRFPRDAETLRALPGIGRYTAGAVASIAFDESTPIVDGNVARVLARLRRIAGDWRERATAEQLWSLAASLVPPRRAGDFNQALMELGATICTPLSPACGDCPIAAHCEAHRHGEVARFPSPRARRESIVVRVAAALLRDRARLAVVRRAPGTRMAGLFDLPAVELDAAADPAAALSRHLAERYGIAATPPRLVGRVKHAITHHRITIEVFECESAGAAEPREGGLGAAPADRGIAARPDESGLRFVREAELVALGVSAMAAKALRAATASRA